MLYLTVFLSGAALMSLEMLGSRILAPFYGSSIFVWGSLIGVILTALSAGYYAGGFLADRFPSLRPLGLLLAAAGVWILCLPALGDVINPWIAAREWGPRASAMLASLLLFAGPSMLLALVSPWTVRLAARDVVTLGRTAGLLSAISTAGSIAGTLVTAFFLIPLVGVANLVKGLGLLLLVLSAGTLGLAGGRLWRLAAGGALALTLAFAAYLSMPGKPSPRALLPEVLQNSGSGAPVGPIAGPTADGVIFEKESHYHAIRVENAGGSRFLRFDDSWQSGMFLSDPLRTRFEYTDCLLLPFALRPEARQALLIGLGGGTVPKKLLAFRPDLNLEVAELDPMVVDVARTYFGLPDHPRLSVAAQDGRQFLARSRTAYDIILMDAYHADSIPFHLTTLEFWEQARTRLAPDGVLAANVIGALQGPRSQLLRSIVRTMSTAFPEVYVVPVRRTDPQSYQNVIVLATRQAGRLQPSDLVAAAQRAASGLQISTLPDYAARVLPAPLPMEDVPVLTDDHAPVDSLMHLYE